MKNKFNISECVEHVTTKKKLIIKDLELIDNQYVYYFDDFVCFPESLLRRSAFSFWKMIFNTSEEEKDRQFKKIFGNIKNEIDDYLK